MSDNKTDKIMINEFVLDDEDWYILRDRNAGWAMFVSRKDGSISLGNGAFSPESIDRFETRSSGETMGICLVITTKRYGTYERYICETREYLKAIKWVWAVNNFYASKIHPKYRKEEMPLIDWKINHTSNTASIGR